MTALFIAIYLIFIFMIVFTSFFAVTRLQKYSINPRLTQPMIFIFILVTVILVAINVMFFAKIPFNDLFSHANFYY